MNDLCKRFGLDVDGAINQLLDYKNSPAKQVRLFANTRGSIILSLHKPEIKPNRPILDPMGNEPNRLR